MAAPKFNFPKKERSRVVVFALWFAEGLGSGLLVGYVLSEYVL